MRPLSVTEAATLEIVSNRNPPPPSETEHHYYVHYLPIFVQSGNILWLSLTKQDHTQEQESPPA